MKKFLILLLSATVILSALCSCNGETSPEVPEVDAGTTEVDTGVTEEPVTPDYLKHELTDKTSLTLENSPIEYSAKASDSNLNLGIDLTVTNGSGEKVVLDDVLFVLERKSANGVGETFYEPVYEGENVNVRLGSKLTATPSEAGTTVNHVSETSSIRATDFYHWATDKDYVVIVDIDNLTLGTVKDDEANTPGWEMYGSIKHDAIGNWSKYSDLLSWMPMPHFAEEGRFSFYVSDSVRAHISEMGFDPYDRDIAISPSLYVRGNGTSFLLKEYRLVECERGLQKAQSPASVSYYTDGIEASLKFANGTGAKAFDYYSNEYTVARKLTLTDSGLLAICGKVSGNVSYDGTAYTVTAEYNGVEYAVTSNRNQNIKFYDSEEDLYNEVSTDVPTENTKYWASYCADFNVGESLYMAVSANAANGDIDLVSTARYAIDPYHRIEK